MQLKKHKYNLGLRFFAFFLVVIPLCCAPNIASAQWGASPAVKRKMQSNFIQQHRSTTKTDLGFKNRKRLGARRFGRRAVGRIRTGRNNGFPVQRIRSSRDLARRAIQARDNPRSAQNF